MARNIPAVAVVMTKQASGNVQIVVQSSLDGLNPSGDIRFELVIPSADFTAFNTTVNGGSSGATLTKVYAEDANPSDYTLGYASTA